MSCFTAPSNFIKDLLTRLYSYKITIPLAPPPPPPPPALVVTVLDEPQAVKIKTSCGCLYEFKLFRRFYKDT